MGKCKEGRTLVTADPCAPPDPANGTENVYDADKNGLLGTDEIMVTLTTQYAKRS